MEPKIRPKEENKGVSNSKIYIPKGLNFKKAYSNNMKALILIMIVLFIPFAESLELGSQEFPEVNLDDEVVTRAEQELIESELSTKVTLPGEILYPFKIFKERLSLLLTFNKAEKAKLHIEFAAERLRETYIIAKKNDNARVEESIELFKEELVEYEKLKEEGAAVPEKEKKVGIYLKTVEEAIGNRKEKEESMDKDNAGAKTDTPVKKEDLAGDSAILGRKNNKKENSNNGLKPEDKDEKESDDNQDLGDAEDTKNRLGKTVELPDLLR